MVRSVPRGGIAARLFACSYHVAYCLAAGARSQEQPPPRWREEFAFSSHPRLSVFICGSNGLARNMIPL